MWGALGTSRAAPGLARRDVPHVTGSTPRRAAGWLDARALGVASSVSRLATLRGLQSAGALLGAGAWRLRTRAARTTLRNLQLCFPELAADQRERLARASLRATGMLACESLAVWSRPLDQTLTWLRREQGESVVTRALGAGQGLIVIAPHIGNWELLNAYLGRTYGLVAMYAAPRNERWQRLVTRQRARAGGEMVAATTAGIRTMLRRLAAGHMVGHMPDQVPPRSGGVHAPFFGVPALTSTLIARLAQRSGAAVVCAAALRVADGAGFELWFDAAPATVGADDVVVGVSAVNAAVERCVRFAPEQYQWEYKRFKHALDGPGDDYYK